jgi:hypothetical protein
MRIRELVISCGKASWGETGPFFYLQRGLSSFLYVILREVSEWSRDTSLPLGFTKYIVYWDWR